MINALISSISEKSLSNFIRTRNGKFIEYKEDISYLVNDFDQFDNLSKLGEIEYDNTDVLLVFSCAYNGILSTRNARKMQFEIAKKALKEDFKDGAVFVFYDRIGNFRFSFIRKNYGDREQKYTNWKRFTYFVDPVSQTNRTFKDRIGDCNFDSLENIQNAFSVEPISKAFFDGYKAQYDKFCDFMQTDKQMQYNFREFLSDGTNKAVRDYVKKMLGRIVFLHFLQKKGWMGVSKDSKNWTGGDLNFIENLFNSSSEQQQANFLDKVLEPMFFDSLNKRRHNDWYDTRTPIGIVKIPYLNGGLFEPDSLDEPDSIFPSSYFKGLFQFFNQFNFTIDENDPNDAEVGVDPEMLGHIFENLLEDNKDKGAFYTPKDIVHYMCQESLIEYLCTALNIDNTDEIFFIQVLVKFHVINKNLYSRISKINTALDIVKICDPAIGSGAFPMGLLHEIFCIKQALWFFEQNDLETFPASDVKLNIIQNSIYGVDIEKGAVDIARLRFWLSLVVDEEIPKPLPNLDYKIMCGNSLNNRFALDMQIASVFAEYNEGKTQKFSLEDYKYLMSDYINVHEGKEIFKNKIEEIKNTFKSVLLKSDIIKRKKKEAELLTYKEVNIFGGCKADIDKVGYNKVKNELDVLIKQEQEILDNIIYTNCFEWRFEFPSLLNNEGDFIGFDIVIANPPYIGQKGNKGLFEKLKKIPKWVDFYERKQDIYYYFIALGIELLNNKGNLTFIIPPYFLTAAGAGNLREFISNNVYISKILNLSESVKVFENAGINSLILFLNKDDKYKDSYIEILEPIITNKVSFINNLRLTQSKYKTTDLNRSEWHIFKSDKTVEIKTNVIKLGEISTISPGIQTGCDKVTKHHIDLYNLNNIQKNDGIFIISNDEYLNLNLLDSEKKFIKPFYKNSAISKWVYDKNNKYWIIITNNIDDINLYPNIKNHLIKYKVILDNRYRNFALLNADKEGKWWYLYGYRPNTNFEAEKIILPYRAINNSFAYSNESFYSSIDVFIINILDNLYNTKYINCILCSKLIEYWLNKNCKRKGKILELYQKPLSEIPIKPIGNKIQSIFVNLFNEVLLLKEHKKSTMIIEQKIDNLVYRLYDLSYVEVKEIDPGFSLSKSEYDKIILE